MTPRNTRRIVQANSAALDRLIRAIGYTPPLSEWAYNPGMVLSGPETAQEATQTGYSGAAKGGSNWSAQTGDFECCEVGNDGLTDHERAHLADEYRRATRIDTHTHGLDDYTCRERLVGECVIEREVAEAVAREREAIAGWLERNTARESGFSVGDEHLGIETTVYTSGVGNGARLWSQVRSGAHDEGGER